ncbi:HAD-IC family P-type ATPase [Candidatus Competibacter phosphatis]|nr:HAD-IC family P-type ATPase [Candidatus Competibacter phosphatis]
MIEAAALLSLLTRDWNDFLVITTLLLFNAVIGFREEASAANALAALKGQLALKARALRDGEWREIAARDLAPGDIVRIRLGDIIPADVKLIEGDYLSVDQAALTGESLPVDKKTGEVAFSGSIAKQGEMVAVVTGTGANTFFGRTAKLVETAGAKSHLQESVLQIGNFLIFFALTLIVVLSAVELYWGTSFIHLLKLALILLVASIPVAMPAVLSVTMALGALKLSKLKAIVSRMEAIEEMAGVDILCSDKTGTMNLTEPQAGSDLSAVRAKAVPEADHYRLYGQKIFITWGDHDLTDNVVHLVLARTPDAPEGVKGISLFLVPKFLVNADSSLGQRNDVQCVSIEHKLGIHASPTCVMSFGDQDGAIGYLVGKENKGLAHMFTMMNEARQKVGIQGLGVADRAYQQARDYAKERVQGRPLDQKSGDRVAIIQHPDVRRMLMTMKSQVEAMRAFAYVMATDMDLAHKHPDAAERQRRQARVDLLIPVVKGWCTELSVEIASTGIQVHGGMGYVEETGACQYLRDARVTPIYEGTTGIQAADLVGRKLAMDQGAAMADLIQEMRGIEAELAQADSAELTVIGASLTAGVQALEQATQWVLQTFSHDPNAAAVASGNYLMLTGYVCGGWQMARAALVAKSKLDAGEDPGFHGAKLATARFYAEQIMPQADALLKIVRSGGSSILALSAEQF